MTTHTNRIYAAAGTLLLLDILFVALHYFFGQQYLLFNLDLEKNLPTYYQGFKLAFAACIVFAYICLTNAMNDGAGKTSLPLVPYLLGFIYLALDEVGEIHENLHGTMGLLGGGFTDRYTDFFFSRGFSSAEWLLFYLPVIIVAGCYFLYLLIHFYRSSKKTFPLFALGTFLLFLVPVLEYLNTSAPAQNLTFGQLNSLIMLEEFFEMAGITLLAGFNGLLLGQKMRQIRTKQAHEE